MMVMMMLIAIILIDNFEDENSKETQTSKIKAAEVSPSFTHPRLLPLIDDLLTIVMMTKIIIGMKTAKRTKGQINAVAEASLIVNLPRLLLHDDGDCNAGGYYDDGDDHDESDGDE